MIQAIIRWLSVGVKQRQALSVQAELEASRNQALTAYREAKATGDTRRQHEASKALRSATTNVLVAQVWGR